MLDFKDIVELLGGAMMFVYLLCMFTDIGDAIASRIRYGKIKREEEE